MCTFTFGFIKVDIWRWGLKSAYFHLKSIKSQTKLSWPPNLSSNKLIANWRLRWFSFSFSFFFLYPYQPCETELCKNIPDQNVCACKTWCFNLFKLLNDTHFIPSFHLPHVPHVSTFQNYCKQTSNESLCRFMINPRVNPTFLHNFATSQSLPHYRDLHNFTRPLTESTAPIRFYVAHVSHTSCIFLGNSYHTCLPIALCHDLGKLLGHVAVWLRNCNISLDIKILI